MHKLIRTLRYCILCLSTFVLIACYDDYTYYGPDQLEAHYDAVHVKHRKLAKHKKTALLSDSRFYSR